LVKLGQPWVGNSGNASGARDGQLWESLGNYCDFRCFSTFRSWKSLGNYGWATLVKPGQSWVGNSDTVWATMKLARITRDGRSRGKRSSSHVDGVGCGQDVELAPKDQKSRSSTFCLSGMKSGLKSVKLIVSILSICLAGQGRVFAASSRSGFQLSPTCSLAASAPQATNHTD